MVTKEIWFMCDRCLAKFESEYLAEECEENHKSIDISIRQYDNLT